MSDLPTAKRIQYTMKVDDSRTASSMICPVLGGFRVDVEDGGKTYTAGAYDSLSRAKMEARRSLYTLYWAPNIARFWASLGSEQREVLDQLLNTAGVDSFRNVVELCRRRDRRAAKSVANS